MFLCVVKLIQLWIILKYFSINISSFTIIFWITGYDIQIRTVCWMQLQAPEREEKYQNWDPPFLFKSLVHELDIKQ